MLFTLKLIFNCYPSITFACKYMQYLVYGVRPYFLYLLICLSLLMCNFSKCETDAVICYGIHHRWYDKTAISYQNIKEVLDTLLILHFISECRYKTFPSENVNVENLVDYNCSPWSQIIVGVVSNDSGILPLQNENHSCMLQKVSGLIELSARKDI